MSTEKRKLKGHDITRIAERALVCTKTVRRWAAGERVHDTTDVRIRRAMKELGVDEGS